MRTYSGHFLSRGNGADSLFFSAPLAVQPGKAFRYGEKRGNELLLAGGFPSTHPDSSVPLSPTVQLNGDLTDADESELTAIAKAELSRGNSQTYGSYTLEPDPRLTVLGADADSLLAFVDTYGGILQITPLLVQGYHPEMVTAEELTLTDTAEGLQLRFIVRQAVDLNRCTYCGACGPACPESCLSEQLFLDFSRCTLCKECLTSCPHGAIDLHAVEKKELLTPAILLLKGARADLPPENDRIYSEDTLPRFFSSVYSTEVEEVITWNQTFCQYSPQRNMGCSACLTACPHGALTQDQRGIQIDHFRCLECGACLAACPTGALRYERFDDIRFIEYFRTFALPPGTTVVLGNEHDLHHHWWHGPRQRYTSVFFLEHPQAGSLSAMHFLFLFAMGAGRIITIDTECGKAAHQCQLVNTILQALFDRADAVRIVSREELSTCLAEEKCSEVLTNYYHDFSYTNRREKVIHLLNFLRQQGNRQSMPLSNSVSDNYGEIVCDAEKCTHCGACVADCRVEALTAHNDTLSLTHSPAHCVQCGICIAVCPEEALSARPGLSLQPSFFEKQTLVQAEPLKCQGCGKVFGTRKSLEKVMAILSAKNLWDSEDDLLNYCDTCRVVNLFEGQEK